MHSFLITAPDKKAGIETAHHLCATYFIDPIDSTYLERQEVEGKLKQSIGIDDIKALQKKVMLKPLKGEKKAIILSDAQLLTIEAQNALLKTLEEPPVNTILILLTASTEALLPTIRSRCKLITLDTPDNLSSPDEVVSLRKQLKALLDIHPAKALSLAEEIGKNKDTALLWLEKAIHVGRMELMEVPGNGDYLKNYAIVLNCLQKAHTTIKTVNVQPRFVLENSFLELIT